MTPDQFPMCKSLGLTVHSGFAAKARANADEPFIRDEWHVPHILASDLERLLSEGVKVFAYKQNPWDEPFAKKEQQIWAAREDGHPTGSTLKQSTALLIDIKEIEKPKPKFNPMIDYCALSISICGLAPEQIEELKRFYERQTGKDATKLGNEARHPSPKRR